MSVIMPNYDAKKLDNLFILKRANDWLADAQKRPAARPLFGDFWLEGELSILFSDTGKGKSTLAVQIAESLARGIPIAPFESVPPAQKIIYVDFELSAKQFETRYSLAAAEGPEIGEQAEDAKNAERGTPDHYHYHFSENFLRAQMESFPELLKGFKDVFQFMHTSLQLLIIETKARVVIVDNATFIRGANTNGKEAAELMRLLKRIKEFYRISILVLAHTPKRSYHAPLSVNDLQGSKMIANFADNIFSLGVSRGDKEVRYLKHIKQRSTTLRYDASNVCLYRIVKPENFLHFQFEGFGSEHDQLRAANNSPALKGVASQSDDGAVTAGGNAADRREMISEMKKMAAAGMTQREIGRTFNVDHTTVGRYLKT
jgi:RecA-family ATPase